MIGNNLAEDINPLVTPNVVWSPHAGAQVRFLSCPAWECLLWGNRGGGKTDALLMDFLQHVGKGYGADWRGLILREATTELHDIVAKTKKWIPQIFPGALYNATKKIWTFPDGETLWLNYARTEEDYWQYHGAEIPWIAFEELTNWPFDDIYLMMMSVNRSSNPNVPRKYRATCNPGGPGNVWVRERFIDMVEEGKIYTDEHGQTRTHIFSDLSENVTLLKADPLYRDKLIAMTQDDPVKYKAWVLGSWDIVEGGFFSDLWSKEIHVLEEFDPPSSWRCYRSFDWGSAKPWAVIYGLECNGEQPKASYVPYFPKGTILICNEIYGWTGKPNEGDRATSQEIASRVLEMDAFIRKRWKVKVSPGPADTAIWEVRDGTSIAANMSSYGCHWTRAYKGPGSRITGWAMIRQMLGAAKRQEIESEHLYVFPSARNLIRLFPLIQRDPKKPEDINTEQEDHLHDALRYLLTRKLARLKRRRVGY